MTKESDGFRNHFNILTMLELASSVTSQGNYWCATTWRKTRGKNDVRGVCLDLPFHQYTWVSKWTLFAYPSPKPAFCPKWTDRVNVGSRRGGEGWMGRVFFFSFPRVRAQNNGPVNEQCPAKMTYRPSVCWSFWPDTYTLNGWECIYFKYTFYTGEL